MNKYFILLIIPLCLLLTGCREKTPEQRVAEYKVDYDIHMMEIESDRVSIEKCNSVGFGHYRGEGGSIYCDNHKLN